jgi:hypothetical protein
MTVEAEFLSDLLISNAAAAKPHRHRSRTGVRKDPLGRRRPAGPEGHRSTACLNELSERAFIPDRVDITHGDDYDTRRFRLGRWRGTCTGSYL